jgi:hypothetical protein
MTISNIFWLLVIIMILIPPMRSILIKCTLMLVGFYLIKTFIYLVGG